jgi:serine protease Do
MTSMNTKAYIIIAIGVMGGIGTVGVLVGGRKDVLTRPAFVAQPIKAGEPGENLAGLRGLNDSFSSLAEYVLPAVVQIRSGAERSSDAQGRRMPTQASEGSGFIYRADGYIITNDHVVSGAKEATVILNDGKELTGTVVSAPEWDVAVIKVKQGDLPTLSLSDSKAVKPGQMVMAIGSPFGLENSVTFGNVSAIGRENVVQDFMMNDGGRFYPDLIQTDAAINVGNSGGPLVNIDGQVIGMNSSIFTRGGGSNGIGFAIPSNQVRLLADILIAKGKVTRSMIGVMPRDLKPYEVKERNGVSGAFVEGISTGSVAEKAGLKKGDLIVQIAGERISSQIDLRNTMLTNAPGTTVKVTYLRDGKQNSVDVKLEEFKADPAPKNSLKRSPMSEDEFGDIFGDGKVPNLDELKKRFKQNKDDEKDVPPLSSGKPKLGVAIENLNSESRSSNGIPSSVSGVLVTSVEQGSLASRLGMKVGDVIEEFGGKKVTTVTELTRLVSELKQGDNKRIKFSRYGKNGSMNFEQDAEFK